METGGSLERRGRALEDEFFHRVDQELAEKLRQKLAREAQRSALKNTCGWADDQLLDDLVAVNISAESLVALSLVPLVQVAWADRTMEPAERDAIIKAAAEHCPHNTVGHQLLDSWLKERPPAQLFETWKEYTAALCGQLSPEAQQALREQVLEQTRAIAKAAGGFLGINAVSTKEEDVLNGIAAVFCQT